MGGRIYETRAENDLMVFRRRLLPQLKQWGGGGRKIIADGIYGASLNYMLLSEWFRSHKRFNIPE
jgi:hypothetical protein